MKELKKRLKTFNYKTNKLIEFPSASITEVLF